ncbi:MAG: N-formylglutamate amidohydrolase [Calothrix sp. MO_192.B10]|nr:N-formylglutamate amidohydrolase [Calothrix sp. MO_192.B10]
MELFTIYQPAIKAVPLIANLPHSGMFVPQNIATNFTPEHLHSLPNTDWHLDKLYNFLPNLGITVMQANYSRYVVDLNRPIKEPLTGNFWTSVIPLQTAFGKPIYTTNPSPTEVQTRIQKFYIPYHNQLETLLKKKLDEFGKVFLIDLHSFGGLIDDQICLGNVNGQTCSESLISTVESNFTVGGYQVVRNKTFTGGYITRNYSKLLGVEALQIEVRYHVYLDENQLSQPQPPCWNIPNFYQARSKFQDIFQRIVEKLNVQ